VACFFAAAQLIEKLTAIHAGHFVVGKNNVGRIIDRFQQGVAAIVRDHHVANVFETTKKPVPAPVDCLPQAGA